MRTPLTIAWLLSALAAAAVQVAPTTPPAATNGTSCRTCHQQERPLHGQADLVPCPREKTAGPRKLTEGPKSITLNTNGLHYGRVAFSHQAHAAMADMGDGCSACHHEATEGAPIRACVACHPASRSRTELDRPDLRGALHRQCLGCHRAWDAEARCESCHGPAVGPAPRPQARIAAPRQLVYETVATNGALATFHHTDHVQTFKLACAQCHANTACADCHDRTRRGQPADRRLRVPEDPETDHARCAACHEQDACARCHADAPRPAFDHARHGIALDEDHADAACAECHLKGNYRAKPDCASCHDDKTYPRDLPGKRTPEAAPAAAAPGGGP